MRKQTGPSQHQQAHILAGRSFICMVYWVNDLMGYGKRLSTEGESRQHTLVLDCVSCAGLDHNQPARLYGTWFSEPDLALHTT